MNFKRKDPPKSLIPSENGLIQNLTEGFKIIEKAAIVISIPLCVTVCAMEGIANLNTLLKICFLVLLLSILRQKRSDRRDAEYREKLKNEPTLEVVNRNRINSFIGYGNILKLIQSSENSIHIISPPKSKNHSDRNRPTYLNEVEEIIEKKLEVDSAFIYKRLIPESKDVTLADDLPLYEHYKKINAIAKGQSNVYCKVIDDLQSKYHFVIIDSKTLILFFPKYVFTSDNTELAGDCAFHLVINYNEESLFLRYLRQQHNDLSKYGETLDLNQLIVDEFGELNSELEKIPRKQ